MNLTPYDLDVAAKVRFSGTLLASYHPVWPRQNIMDNRDDRYSPVVDELSDFATDALSFTSQPAPGSLKDVTWLRCLKYLSIITLPALVFGLGFLFEDYFLKSNGRTYYQRQLADSRVQRESVRSMRLRFAIGAVLGGGLGFAYVIRRVIRKVVP